MNTHRERFLRSFRSFCLSLSLVSSWRYDSCLPLANVPHACLKKGRERDRQNVSSSFLNSQSRAIPDLPPWPFITLPSAGL
jgi:hypothetical protein